MRNFKELKVWHKSHQLCLKVYAITESYPDTEKYGLISQLRRASSSVPTNIAEACGYETSNEFMRFLKIASGSISEVEYLILLSKDLDFLPGDKYEELEEEVNMIKKMLYKLRVSQINR